MGLINIPTPTTTTPDTDNDTPPHTQPIRPFSFTNGAAKNHQYYHHLPLPHAAVVYCYRECMKNHAANIGAHALDGCGEFMASPVATPADPTSLTCVACGCHRNFHRRYIDDSNYAPFNPTMTPHFLDFRQPRRQSSSSPSPPQQQPPLPPTTLPYAPPHMLIALSTAANDDQEVPNHHQVATPVTPRDWKAPENLNGRKRFRTKFSQDQKEKMHFFAEKLGWKMPKCDETMVENFCNEIGVTRGVLKVWMHNNKNSFGRKDIINTTNNNRTTNMEEDISNIGNGRISSENGNIMNSSMNNVDDENSGSHCNNESGDVHLDHNINNGSSSSS